MSAQYKNLAVIKKVIDHDCGLYTVGEIEGSFQSHELKEYLDSYGEYGKNQLLHKLAYLQFQVIEAWRNRPDGYEGCSNQKQG